MIFQNGAIDKLKTLSEVDWIEEGKNYTPENLAKDIAPYDACITSWGSAKVTKEVLENATRLKFVGHAAGTVVPIEDPEVFDRNVTVVNANSVLAMSTAEAAVALIMAGAWDLHGYNIRMSQGIWSKNSSETVLGLCRQKIGLIGYGDISKEVIRLLKPFGVQVLLYSRYCLQEEAEKLGVKLCSLEDLLKNSRIISLHNTLTPATRGMLGSKELSQVGDGSLIVNTARGPIIDEQALLKLPNVLCVPHIGGYASYWKTRLGLTVVEEMERWLQGQELQGQITAEKFNRLTPR